MAKITLGEALTKPFHIVLWNPQIPQNTGSIARLCACTDTVLHLIEPLGFEISDKAVKRAGLDYWEHVPIFVHSSWEHFIEACKPTHLYLLSKFATQSAYSLKYQSPAFFVFGSESKGLPPQLHQSYPSQRFKIPMRTHLVRSLNLAQAVAIVLYEAQRQSPPDFFIDLPHCLEESH